jgi:exodeoxyribonuclease VII small subunit
MGMADKRESFEMILKDLESVVETLEAGDLPLEDALEKFEHGIRLSREGAKRIEEAERRIQEILSDGKIVPVDVDE